VGIPVACGNLVCNPGDAIIGDRDGIIIIARKDVAAYAEKVAAQDGFEESLRAKIRASIA